MKLSEIVKESLVTINKSPFIIINVDSFHEELTKRGVVLTELQLSCLYNKYCCKNTDNPNTNPIAAIKKLNIA